MMIVNIEMCRNEGVPCRRLPSCAGTCGIGTCVKELREKRCESDVAVCLCVHKRVVCPCDLQTVNNGGTGRNC